MDIEKAAEWWVNRLLVSYPIKVFEVVSFLQEASQKIVDAAIRFYEGKEVDVSEAVYDVMRFLATDRKISPAESIKLFAELRDFLATQMNLSSEERLKFTKAFEEIMFKAFDAYMVCREKIFELRLREKDREIEMMRKIMEYSSKSLSSPD